jgi:hypothetical protein
MLVRTLSEWLGDGFACQQAALTYLGVGWCAIPCCPADHVGVGKAHGKTCKSPGKSPLVSGWTCFAALPTADQIRSWWKQWPNAGIGIVLGQVSHLVGLDIDGAAGEAAWARAARAGQLPPPTASFTTSGVNRRLLFSLTADQVVAIDSVGLGEDQELRILGEGALTIAPPTRHFEGGYYEWTTFSRPQATGPKTTR